MPGLLRSLYICYLSLEDPLVRTQVVAYLEGLAARGHTIHLLTYEPKLSRERRRALATELASRGITWRSLRYHKRPSLPATVYDALAGALLGTWLVHRHKLDAVHARSHVPAATGLIVRRLTRRRLIFDIRGLLGDEYADAGRWRRDGAAYRLTAWIQRRAIARADGIVVLTERVRGHLFGASAPERTFVIPCCADLDRVAGDPGEAERLRSDLELGGRSVMVYVGKLTAPYMDREMARFFAVARRADPGLAFLVVTQAPPDSIVAELDAAGIAPADYRITYSAPERIGDHLGLADFAICFCQPSLARIASSPTKLGEYLGAGLPIVSGPDIGDMDAILGGGVGAVVGSFDEDGYERGVQVIRAIVADGEAAERCRTVARQVFSLTEVGIPRYDRLYREVAAVRRGRGRAMRVGYAAYSPDLTQPADRRRFPFYAGRRGIEFELADPARSYDVVVVTPRADLRTWSRYRSAGKLVFDIVDSYLAIPRANPKAMLRGPAKFAAGEARHPFFSYRAALESIVRRADAVTCATPEQAALIAPLCPNVHPILDFHAPLVRRVKEDYQAGSPFNLVWEGLGENARWFGLISDALAEVASRHPLVLHLITAVEYRQVMQRFWRRRTARIVARHFHDVRIHQWQEETVSEIATALDLAVIPLPLGRPLERGKPENKLISFWRMGLPVVTSATPAYSRVMEAAGQDLLCGSDRDWVQTLLRVIEDQDLRARAGRLGRAFAEREYGEERLLRAWDRVFASLRAP